MKTWPGATMLVMCSSRSATAPQRLTSEELAHYGVEPDFEPSRPKMGSLVNEAVQYATRLMEKKRNGAYAAADSLHLVLDRIVGFITSVIPRDSCFIYLLEGESLTLSASKNPHAEIDELTATRCRLRIRSSTVAA